MNECTTVLYIIRTTYFGSNLIQIGSCWHFVKILKLLKVLIWQWTSLYSEIWVLNFLFHTLQQFCGWAFWLTYKPMCISSRFTVVVVPASSRPLPLFLSRAHHRVLRAWSVWSTSSSPVSLRPVTSGASARARTPPHPWILSVSPTADSWTTTALASRSYSRRTQCRRWKEWRVLKTNPKISNKSNFVKYREFSEVLTEMLLLGLTWKKEPWISQG